MAFIGLDLSQNLSLYTVPAAFILAFIPHSYAAIASGKSYDPAYPRKLASTLAADNTMDKPKKMRILRAKAAFENGIETLGFYSAGVVAANVAGVEVATLNALTLGYVLCRILYNVAYINLQDNRAFAPLRSLVWLASIGLTFTLYVKAGLKSA